MTGGSEIKFSGGQSVVLHAVLEDSWPYFNNALALSGPIGNPFYTKSEAKRFYSKISSCLDCDYSDLECLRSKTLQEITDCSWGSNILTEDGPSYIGKFDPCDS